MRWLLFWAAGALAAAPAIRLEPAVITSCQSSGGAATVFWNSDGVAPVTVYAGDTPMTGAEPATGSAATGAWVADGMSFSLRDAEGRTLASVNAAVRCDALPWWPLTAGNEWHFRRNDRVSTGQHSVWRVLRREVVNGVEWAVLEGAPSNLSRLRTAEDGALYSRNASGAETLLLDPSGQRRGEWAVTGMAPLAVTLAGTFSGELSWQGPVQGLGRDSGRFARGIGPSYFQTNVIAGSSGGFGAGYTLLEAVIAGARFTPAYPRLELGLEANVVDFSVKSARNCALPCYFVACFGADLPGTYKPCLEASVRGGAGRLALLDPGGVPVFETAADGWVRIPLYRAPATLLPAGKYSVRATVGASVVTLPLEIR